MQYLAILISCDDTFSFEQKAMIISVKHQEEYPQFVAYLDRIKGMLLDNVNRAHSENTHKRLYNSESI